GRIDAVQSEVYGPEHGVSSTIGVGGHQPLSFQAQNGWVWFAMDGGFSGVNPDRFATNPRPPLVHIERVAIDGVAFDVRNAVKAPPGRGDLAIGYTALSFLAPQKVRFKYRLDGVDQQWVEAEGRRAANYSNVS